MYKVLIEKSVKRKELVGDFVTTTISIDAVKPFSISEDEWSALKDFVISIASGNTKSTELVIDDAHYNIKCILNNNEVGILAESEHYYIRKQYEDASLYSKLDSKHIASVGDFYGDPMDAYISNDESYCITIGCGIIKYFIKEPFEDYQYDISTSQWIETGRYGDDIEWCDTIEEIGNEYIIVSSESEDKRKFRLSDLGRVFSND